MNQQIALITAFVFIVGVFLYQTVYTIVKWKDPKIKRTWIWLRAALSFFAFLGAVLYWYFLLRNAL